MRVILCFVLLGLLIVTCTENNIVDNNEPSNVFDKLVSISGLSLYWDHEVFGHEGRRLRFQLHDVVAHQHKYELEFHYILDNNTIDVYLIDIADHGKCAVYPSPQGVDNSTCLSSGGFYIPDSLLDYEYYKFNLHTKDFTAQCGLNISNSSYQLTIPDNDYFKSSIEYVFPIPKDIIWGSIVFKGEENIEHAQKLKSAFCALGLFETSVPNYPYRHLKVNDEGTRSDKIWPPDNYSYKFLYKTNGVNFRQIVEVANRSFSNTTLNISFSSGMGDEAIFSQNNGIYIVYADEF